MRSEREIGNAFLQLMNEKTEIEIEMTKQDYYRNDILQYNNLQAKRDVIATECRILQWVLSE